MVGAGAAAPALDDGMTTGAGPAVELPVLLSPKLAPATGMGVMDDCEEVEPDEPLLEPGAEVEDTGGGGVAPFASRGPPVIGSRYQFTDGSPRHSPSGTRSYFSWRAVSIMNCANWWTVKS
jgi:hypothetical protein